MDCFLGIIYVTLGLEDQGFYCLVLNNMLSGSCVIKCLYMCVYIDMECVIVWKLYAIKIIVHDT